MKALRLLPYALALAACGLLLDFDVRFRIPEQQVPAVAPGALGALLPPELLPAIPIELQETSEFKRQDAGEVRSVRLDKLTLALTDGSTQRTFDFLDSIQIDARSQNGARSVHVAGLTTVPKGVDSLTLETTRNELIDIVGTDFALVVTMTGRSPPSEARFDGRAVFEVKADPKGVF